MRDEVLGLINKLKGKELSGVNELDIYIKKSASYNNIELDDDEVEYIINSLKGSRSKKPNIPLVEYTIKTLCGYTLVYNRRQLRLPGYLESCKGYLRSATGLYARNKYNREPEEWEVQDVIEKMLPKYLNNYNRTPDEYLDSDASIRYTEEFGKRYQLSLKNEGKSYID